MTSLSPKLISSQLTELSPWVTLSTKQVLKAGESDIAVYHSFQQSDYVTTLATRTDGLIPIVQQYRPAVEQITFELPGGLLDRDATPESIAVNELLEETGHQVVRKVFVVPHLIEYSALTKFPESGWVPFLFSVKSLEKDFA